MKSVDTPTTAVRLSTQLRDLLTKGGFRLTKWLSNDRRVLAEIQETERAVSVANLDLQVYLEGIRKASAFCTERSDDET